MMKHKNEPLCRHLKQNKKYVKLTQREKRKHKVEKINWYEAQPAGARVERAGVTMKQQFFNTITCDHVATAPEREVRHD
jgi:hypothetical protein